MGSSMHVRCTKCGLQSDGEVMWGEGMFPVWQLFEHRLYHCKKCSTLQSAMVLRPDKVLRAELQAMPQRWQEPSWSMSMAELAELLMQARRWPRCETAGCGGRLHGSKRDDEDGGLKGCPSCGGALQVTRGGLLWD